MELIKCANCTRTLSLPTTKEAAEGWERHSKHVNGKLKFIYTCGKCDHRKVLARFVRR